MLISLILHKVSDVWKKAFTLSERAVKMRFRSSERKSGGRKRWEKG
jgi:hypothetical protein